LIRAARWTALLALLLLAGRSWGEADAEPGGGAPTAAVDDAALALRQLQLEDSLELGLALFGELLRRQDSNPTDSLKLSVQRGVGRHWFEWAFQAPRPTMDGQNWIHLGNLFGLLDGFDMLNAYERQLNCYRYAIQYPETRRAATLRLHAEYHRAGFAPGMLQTGQALLDIDREAALRDGVAKSMALASYFLGDRKAALKWIKQHLKARPEDQEGRDLQRRIREMKRRRDRE
jgi:tetratricopeptide (TPR) repeat protein